MVCVGLLYGSAPLLFSLGSFLQFTAPFRIWNSGFTLQIGNEPTFDRPWVGKIYFVALYNRALSPHEIAGTFSRGFASATATRHMDEHLISLYTFAEGMGDTVHDTSGFESPLDLSIAPKGHVRWLDPHGIEIVRPAIVRSQEAATKIFEAVNVTQEMTIEAWLIPKTTAQAGPARIISFSGNRGERNFMLGQELSDIHFRLRTSVSEKPGTALGLKTTTGFLTPETIHLVATYKGGLQRLYVNGVEQAEALNLKTAVIIGFGTRKTAFAQVAYSFFYFFPVSFLLAVFASTRSIGVVNTLLLPCAVGAGLLATAEIFQAFAFHRGMDIPLLGYGLIITTMGAVMGRVVGAARPVSVLS
jgi:Concanavalin A-like lectin/glucanases superfamily